MDNGSIETGGSVTSTDQPEVQATPVGTGTPQQPVEKPHSPSLLERLQGLFDGKKEEKALVQEGSTADVTPSTPAPVLGDELIPQEKSSLEEVKVKADEGLIGGPDDQPKEPVQNIQYNPLMGDDPADIASKE
jgi:hypothetical protein